MTACAGAASLRLVYQLRAGSAADPDRIEVVRVPYSRPCGSGEVLREEVLHGAGVRAIAHGFPDCVGAFPRSDREEPAPDSRPNETDKSRHFHQFGSDSVAECLDVRRLLVR